MANIAQDESLLRFVRKLPANARTGVRIMPLPNGGIAAQARSAGRVPGSCAIYEKQIDRNGRAVQYTKTTYDQFGHMISVKDKITGGVLT